MTLDGNCCAGVALGSHLHGGPPLQSGQDESRVVRGWAAAFPPLHLPASKAL